MSKPTTTTQAINDCNAADELTLDELESVSGGGGQAAMGYISGPSKAPGNPRFPCSRRPFC